MSGAPIVTYRPLWSGKRFGCGYYPSAAFVIHKAWEPADVYLRIEDAGAMAAAAAEFDAGLRDCDALGLAEWVDAWCEGRLRAAGLWRKTMPNGVHLND